MTETEKFYDFLKADHAERSSILNLNASENHMSPTAKQILSSPVYDDYDFPPCSGKIIGPWRFSSDCHHEKLIKFIAKQTYHFLGTDRIDIRPRGGQAAEISVLLGLSKTGDQVFHVSESAGGHFGLNYIAKKCNILLHEIVFNNQTHLIDISLTLKKMSAVWQKNSNKLMLINQSFILQTQHWQQIIACFKAKYPEMIISCDVSHLLGLIVGRQLDNPLKHGVDLIHGSTHKSFPGPQKALIAFHSDLADIYVHKITQAVSPGLQSSSGSAEMMALAYVFCEMKTHGISYARKVCQHAHVIAESLMRQGIRVTGSQFGYTQTHQVWLPMDTEHKAWHIFAQLHLAGIRVLPAWLPFENIWGIRLGTNALTRRSLTSKDFMVIAKWISKIIKSEVSTEVVRHKVRELTQSYSLSKLKYTLTEHI